MSRKAIFREPYLLFLPLLVYYGYIIKKAKWPTLYGDEIRYVDFAKHLLEGYYSPTPPHINLWNGPGYPILLMPFEALHIPDLYITLFNAVLLYLTLVFLCKALLMVAKFWPSVLLTLAYSFYPGVLSMLPILYTEIFTGFLVAALIYSLMLWYKKGGKLLGITSGLILGFLTLTKIIFGYVLIIGLMIYLILLMIRPTRIYYRKALLVLVVAFGLTIPYLVYTYWLTGKPMYWGDSGGMSLYWMSTPYEHEYGDWKLPTLNNRQYPTSFQSAEVVTILKKNHSADMAMILKHNELQQDELFKQIAIQNIKKNPLKFAANYYNNCSRMLFNFPYSYSFQDAAIGANIISGSLVLWAGLLGMVLTVINRRRIITPLKLLLFITALYLLASAALSAYPRQLIVILPVLLFWWGFLAGRIKKPDLTFTAQSNNEVIL